MDHLGWSLNVKQNRQVFLTLAVFITLCMISFRSFVCLGHFPPKMAFHSIDLRLYIYISTSAVVGTFADGFLHVNWLIGNGINDVDDEDILLRPGWCVIIGHSPHKISAGGSLLFMRCVSLISTGLVSAWRREEAPWAILAEPVTDCVTVLCLRQWKQGIWKFVKFLKNTCYFQTNWISCILNWGVRFDVVSDAGHTCCCSLLFFF